MPGDPIRTTGLREMVEERFGTIPEGLAQRIEVCNDSAKLRTALRQIIRVNSPEKLSL